jgi:hypothetical protein
MVLFNRFKDSEVVARAVRADLTEWIVGSALVAAEQLVAHVARDGRTARPGPDVQLMLGVEFACFNYHMTDRAVFQRLGERRDAFMDALHDEVVDALLAPILAQPAMRKEEALWRRNMQREIASFMEEYGRYRADHRDVSRAGHVLWEFGKRVSKTVGHSESMPTITAAMHQAGICTKIGDLPRQLARLVPG